MIDPFENRAPNLSGPAADIVPITANDATDMAQVAAALYVEVGGSLSIVTSTGEVRSVVVGDLSTLPVRTARVRSTGTTATGIHALVLV